MCTMTEMPRLPHYHRHGRHFRFFLVSRWQTPPRFFIAKQTMHKTVASRSQALWKDRWLSEMHAVILTWLHSSSKWASFHAMVSACARTYAEPLCLHSDDWHVPMHETQSHLCTSSDALLVSYQKTPDQPKVAARQVRKVVISWNWNLMRKSCMLIGWLHKLSRTL